MATTMVCRVNLFAGDSGFEMMKSSLLVALLMLTLYGCGLSHVEEKNCVPQVPFVSTSKILFNLVDVDDESYSTLKLDQGEQYLCVNVPSDGRSCKDFNLDYFPKAITAPLPEGSKLILTGKMIKAVPWGLMTGFRGELIHLQGVVDGQVVWATETDLRVISSRPEVSETNFQSFLKTTLPEGYGDSKGWQCPNNPADALQESRNYEKKVISVDKKVVNEKWSRAVLVKVPEDYR